MFSLIRRQGEDAVPGVRASVGLFAWLISAAALTVLWSASAGAGEPEKCERPSGEPVPVFDRQARDKRPPSYGIDAEFDEEEGSVIVVDPFRAKRLPWLVREFEIARQCALVLKAERRADWNPNMRAIRYKDPVGYENASRRLQKSLREVSEKKSDRRTDCEAIERLRRNQVVGYKELRELADFYASASKRFPDLLPELTVYRAKNLLSCWRTAR